MSMKKHISAAIFIFVSFTGIFCTFAQNPEDAVARVKELESFHEVIFKIWHEAWPNKDTAMLKDLLPEVEKGIAQVASAKLPGIMREKKNAWEDGVAQLQASGAEYKAATETDDEKRMLGAAETLHRRFETLMLLTRPAFTELEDFHSSLYLLYHYYLPEYDYEKIRSSAEELNLKMQILNGVTLPARLKSKENEFQVARENLSESVEAFRSSVATNQEEVIKEAIETLHDNYQAVQGIFN